MTAVVILNWNKAELTRQCLDRARAATRSPVHWIVVDNGSDKPIADLPADVTVLRNGRNLGFSGGVNVGLRHAFAAGAAHAWLLNNDAEPLPGALDTLVAACRADPGIGLASAVILNSDAGDAIFSHGGVWLAGDYRRITDPVAYGNRALTAPRRIWLPGTALLVSRDLVEWIGYFDERLFAYWEDNDFSRRSAAAGFRNVVVPGACVRHPCGDDGTVRPPYYHYLMARNELLLLRKFRDGARPFWWALRRLWRWQANPSLPLPQCRAIRDGIRDGLLGRGGPYRR